LKAVKNNKVIEQAGVFEADTPNSSHYGTNIMPPPIPTMDPMSPAWNAEFANLCISGEVNDFFCSRRIKDSEDGLFEFTIALIIIFTIQKQAPRAARLQS